MTVVLKHADLGLYYAGPRHWVGQAASALDLQSIERAAETSREEPFGHLDIVVNPGDPDCELVLPLTRQRRGEERTQTCRLP
jgi:hypothetical protein